MYKASRHILVHILLNKTVMQSDFDPKYYLLLDDTLFDTRRKTATASDEFLRVDACSHMQVVLLSICGK